MSVHGLWAVYRKELEDHFSSTRSILLLTVILMVGLVTAYMAGSGLRKELEGMAKPSLVFLLLFTSTGALFSLAQFIAFFGPLIGPYLEYHVDRNLVVGLDTRFGAIIDAYSSDAPFHGSGTQSRFGFRAQMTRHSSSNGTSKKWRTCRNAFECARPMNPAPITIIRLISMFPPFGYFREETRNLSPKCLNLDSSGPAPSPDLPRRRARGEPRPRTVRRSAHWRRNPWRH